MIWKLKIRKEIFLIIFVCLLSLASCTTARRMSTVELMGGSKIEIVKTRSIGLGNSLTAFWVWQDGKYLGVASNGTSSGLMGLIRKGGSLP
jgi:hypothetical protein